MQTCAVSYFTLTGLFGWGIWLSSWPYLCPYFVTIKMHTCEANDKTQLLPAGFKWTWTCSVYCKGRPDPERASADEQPSRGQQDPVACHRLSLRGTCRVATPQHTAAREAWGCRGVHPRSRQEAQPPRPQVLHYRWHWQHLHMVVWLAQPSCEHHAAILFSHFQLCFIWNAFAKARVKFHLPNEFSPTEVKFIHARALILASKEFLLM